MCRYGARVHVAALLAVLVLGGCKLGKGPSIREILADPAKYEGKALSLSGTVEAPIQVLGYGTCKLNDGTGQLTVITAGKSRSAGAKATIKGTVKSAFNLGRKTVVVLIEEGAKTGDDKR